MVLNLRSMPGFLEVFGYYDPQLKRYNIDVRACSTYVELASNLHHSQPTV
jgi:hypothetical protein